MEQKKSSGSPPKKKNFIDKIPKIFKGKDSQSTVNAKRFHATASEGLTSQQVDERIAEGLVNKSEQKYSKSYKSIFLGNICTGFNLICAIAALSLILAGAPLSQYLFVAIFSVNMLVGIILEILAKRKLDRLTILSAPTANAVRDGKLTEIHVNQIVLDDVLILSAGQQVPADCIVIEGMAELNESLLTGESIPIKKEEGSFLYAGSFVTSGKIAARTEKIGDHTYINKLTSKAKTYKRPKSEIMNSINLFIKVIGFVIAIVAFFMFSTNYNALGGNWEALNSTGGFFAHLFGGDEILSKTIQKTASVVIGMIPSGLLLLTTVALTMGIIRLSRYNTLVQDIYSLEMLARVNVLCLDKTGTITDGRMKVSDCILLNAPNDLSIDDVMGSMLASLEDNNQTSIALYERFGHSSALHPIATLPFSSARKLSAVTFEEVGTYVMGAPEFVLKPLPIRIEKIINQYTQMGLRVLVLAHATGQIQGDKLPNFLRPVAIITLADNVRPDAVETIKWFKENDVDVKVISGDNPVTVSEVARRAGIKNASKFLSLEGLSNIEVENAANEYTVFGRVSPEQKAVLIRAIKKAGNTVGMTGDGVNDILAMKEADCAVAVASGSEATRNVANLVLQDNNFSSMPKVVNEGRRVINNVKNSASLYIMKTLLILILAVTCICLEIEYFFTTNNMLIYEFIISAIPSVALSLQPNINRVKGRFIPYVLSRALPGALTMAVAVLSLHVVRYTGFGEAFSLVQAGVETPEYHALMMLALTFSGVVMLFRICQPFNVFRAGLFAVSFALCVLAVCIPALGNIIFNNWDTLQFSLQQILLIIIIVQAAFPLSNFLIKTFDLINPAEE